MKQCHAGLNHNGTTLICVLDRHHAGAHTFIGPREASPWVLETPAPTALDKAWEENWSRTKGAVLEPGPIPPAYKYHFRAGWQARGKATIRVLDKWLTRVANDEPFIEQYKGRPAIGHAALLLAIAKEIGDSGAGDECK